MQTQLTLTPATPEQKSAVVPLMQAAGCGMFEFLMNNIVPFINVKTILPMIYGRDDNILSYRYIQIATLDQDVVAALSVFPIEQRVLSPLLKEHVPADRLAHLMPFFESKWDNSLYINLISVVPSHQNQGIGTYLLKQAEQLARSRQLSALSLHVWADHTRAITLFERAGFVAKETLAIPSHPRLAHEGGMLLFVKALDL